MEISAFRDCTEGANRLYSLVISRQAGSLQGVPAGDTGWSRKEGACLSSDKACKPIGEGSR